MPSRHLGLLIRFEKVCTKELIQRLLAIDRLGIVGHIPGGIRHHFGFTGAFLHVRSDEGSLRSELSVDLFDTIDLRNRRMDAHRDKSAVR